MKSKSERCRQALMAGAIAVSLLLAACGGGEQVKKFVPSRVIAFGDETSVISDVNGDANGRKYTDNATVSATDPTLNCRLNPIWIQLLASNYGLVFPQCNPQPNAVAAPSSRIRASAGAKVADLSTQIDAQLAETPFTPTDLVTVLIGQNDILAQYAQYPTLGEAQITVNLQAAGTALGVQVNRIATAGAKVVVSTVPDIGATPFALNERATHTDTDRAALLYRLTKAFNDKMRAQLINDGRMIGLLLTDEYIDTTAQTVGGAFTNTSVAVCVPPSAFDCTSLTLIANGSGTTYLWADSTHLSSGGHYQLGSLAITRAADNPF